MQEYKVTLKNEKVRFYNRISQLAIIINTLIFLYFSFSSSDKKIMITCGAGVAAVAVCFFLNFYLQKNNAWQKIWFIVIFDLLTVLWILLGNYLVAIIPAAFSILSVLATRKLEILFIAYKIVYPSFPPKTFQWDEVSNIVLKDGLLTIDFKSNKLLQREIIENNSLINEKEFNDFCSQQLSKSQRLTTPDS